MHRLFLTWARVCRRMAVPMALVMALAPVGGILLSGPAERGLPGVASGVRVGIGGGVLSAQAGPVSNRATARIAGGQEPSVSVVARSMAESLKLGIPGFAQAQRSERWAVMYESTLSGRVLRDISATAQARLQARWASSLQTALTGSAPVAGAPSDSGMLSVPAGASSRAVQSDDMAVERAPQGTVFPDVGPYVAAMPSDSEDLSVSLEARLESKVQRLRNDRCTSTQLSTPGNSCRSTPILPEFDFQFNLRSSGVVAERFFVDVDYDSQREFDASNNLSARYEGRAGARLQRVEVGNVTFQPPPSHFITSGIPSGNYGVQATGQLGPMRFTSIFAQQKGNIARDNIFTVGQRTRQQVDRVIEDIQVEQRRFFFTLDPRQLTGYPNVDLLDQARMQQLAAALPDSIRPVRIYVYRQLIGAANQNPRGPALSVRGARNPTRQVYELLREHVDYYVDPSMLWIALVRPLSAGTERLAIAYEVNVDGQPGRNPATGGSPDIEYTDSPQYANLLWEPELQPGNAAYFLREIKSVYRLAGEDMQRESLQLRLVTGTSGDQEKPVDPSLGETYLRLFGLAQPTSPAAFDIENRVWPRPNDSNIRLSVSGIGEPQKLIPDYFVIFPSVQPFARAGLARPLANPANDTLYQYPNEYLYSAQRPQAIYRMIVSYQSQGSSDTQAIQLNTIQLRPNSERVSIDGRALVRHADYEIDYDIGIITFIRPDTLFPQPRQVAVRYEENPLFTTIPTTILGFASQFQLDVGQVAITAISQRQRSTFTRPPLGFEQAGSFVAGMTTSLQWDAAALTRGVARLPFARSSSPSRIALQAEFAMSKPQPNAAGQAYIESFEGSADRAVPLLESSWYFSSLPARGTSPAAGGLGLLSTARAATLAYQNNGLDRSGTYPQFTIQQIDPSVRMVGSGVQPFEQLLWMTMYPLRIGGMPYGQAVASTARYAWTVGDNSMAGPTPTGRRWRSLRTVLNPSGQDLSRTENVEFFVLVQSETDKLHRNPTLVLDFGDISENSVTFAPETLTVSAPLAPGLPADTTYRGKRLVGHDRLDSERDPLSRAFNAAENDRGLAGDVADTIVVVDRTGTIPLVTTRFNVPLCTQSSQSVRSLDDNRANCTTHNNRLDEEDIDLDGQLNMTAASADQEQLKRFVVNLSDPGSWTRVGRCFQQRDSSGVGITADSLCWVQVRLNWRAPTEELNSPNDRRVRAMRITMVSGANMEDDAFSRIALARLRLVGAPWLKRGTEPLSGMAGDSSGAAGGFVIASVIGTLDSTSAIPYSSPPGVVEAPESRRSGYENTRVQVNEQALRIQAGVPGRQFRPFDRAEAFLRFPEGTKTFMGYRSLRMWMRGRGNGWGVGGELNGYVKIGRDEHNFYMYRTPVNSGSSQSAWLPEIHVDLTRFQALRAQLEVAFMHGGADSLQCTGVDLELIRRSGTPSGAISRRYAVCHDGYIVYTADPAVTPPNLAGVQELAVGFLRVDSIPRGAEGIMSNDTLELWVNDIRLGDVVDDMGFAGEIGLNANAGDLASIRLNLTRRDPNFRQLGEAPTFLTSNAVSMGTTLHLDRALPANWGIALPFSVDYSGTGVEQLFVNRTDVRAGSIDGVRDPNDRRVSYSLAMRRTMPLERGWYAPLVNAFSVNGTWTSGSSQSTFQRLESSSFVVGAGLTLADETRESRLPEFVKRIVRMLPRRLRDSDALANFSEQHVRWRPTEFRLTSSLARTSNSATSFSKAAASPTDTGAVVSASTHGWRNMAMLAFRPTPGVSADFAARQLLDLRDYRLDGTYADNVDRGQAAHAARMRLLGADVGLERERSFTSALRMRPSVSDWVKPSLDFTSSFALSRDPNARTLLRMRDSTGAFRLPQRFGVVSSLSLGTTFDPGRILVRRSDNAGWMRRIGGMIEPFDFQWQRGLTSNYDNTAFNPGSAYQLGLGGVNSFRGVDARLATTAGRMRRTVAVGSLNLPLAFRLQARVESGTNEMWTRRLMDGFQALITSSQTVHPDISLRWNWRPRRIQKVISMLYVDAGYTKTEQETTIPNETGGLADRGRLVASRKPISASVTWAFLGDLITSVRTSSESREDLRPGSIISGNTERRSVSVARTFTLPESWNTRNGQLRASASYDSEENSSVVAGTTVALGNGSSQFGVPTVLTNNGRRALNINANTDLSELLTFTLTGSRVVSFDRAYNRQTTNVILSMVLQIRFFSGTLR